MEALLTGFETALSPINLFWAMAGAVLGTLVGVLPGVGPAATVALLLPVTFGLPPINSLMLLAGIYYGAQYGGSTTSILLNVPGESGSVVTCLDGYPMARQGKAGLALAISAIGSFVAGTLGLILFTFAAGPLAEVGLAFGPPELVLLMMMALVLGGAFGESLRRGLISVSIGLLLATVGADPISGINRFVFEIPYLYEGFDFVPVAVGLFAVGEVFWYVLQKHGQGSTAVPSLRFRELFPSGQELRSSLTAITRGSFVGFFMGLLPGLGASTASFVSYSLEKRVSRHPERFGRGAVEGVASPESANNSAVIGALLPMFALGIPGSATTAMLLAGLMMWGLQPGPLLMVQRPDVVWPVIASLYLANTMLLLINMPGAILLAQITRIPMNWLMPAVLAISLAGAYSSTTNLFGPIVALVFGVIGVLFRRGGYPMAPLLLGLVLGRPLEQNLRRSLILSHGSLSIFFTRELSIAIIALTLLLLLANSRLGRRSAGDAAGAIP